jgi:multiple sugar transport system substrate-binding protein
MAMSQQSFEGPRALSRRRFLFVSGVALGAGGLLAACQSAAAPPAPTSAPAAAPTGAAAKPAAAAPTAAPVTTGASALKGTKLTIIGGNSYVPAQDGELDNLVKQLGQDTGMDAKVERYADAQMDAKVAAVIESGGADVAVLRDTDPHLYANKLLDVTDIANELDAAWGGWFDVAKQAGIVNGQWKALMLGQAPAAWNWRPDFFSAAGVSKFPDTFDELLAAAPKLKDYGKPIGMSMGHAPGDGKSTNFPVLWAFGGKEFEADGKTVALSSPETLAAIKWYTAMYKYMDPAVIGWGDADNNQAFLTEQCSATVNVNTIYLGARDAADQKGDLDKKRIADAMDHANWPSGPAGRFANYNINLWAGFADSPNPDGIRAFMRAFFDKKFLVPWTKTGRSYFIPNFKGLDAIPEAWPDDPKLKIFRELNKINRLPGYAGPPSAAATDAINKFVLVDMFANAATGKMKPEEAMAWATDQYKQSVDKVAG